MNEALREYHSRRWRMAGAIATLRNCTYDVAIRELISTLETKLEHCNKEAYAQTKTKKKL